MKRTTLIIGLIFILLLLASCKETDRSRFDTEDYLEAYDQNRNIPPIFDGICKGNDAFYICTHSGKMLLRFYDTKSGLSMPLCAKPECAHTDENCNAVISGYANGLSVYDGKLCWAAVTEDFKYAVYCENTDGTVRQIVRELPDEWVGLDDYTVFHRGIVYAAGVLGNIKAGKTEYIVKASGASLDTKDSFDIVEKTLSETDPPRVSIQALGNTLYIGIATVNTFELYSWSISKSELNTVFTGNTDFVPGEFWIGNDGVIYLSGGTAVYTISKNNALTIAFDFSEMGSLARIAGFSDDNVIADELCDDGTINILIKDHSGNKVAEKNLGDIGKNMGRAYFGCCDDSLIYRFFDIDAGTMTYMSIPIKGGEAVLLWEIKM